MDGYAGTLGVSGQDAADGHSRLDFTADESHLNPAGSVHGGVLATLVDTAMGLAVRSATVDSDVPATSQLTITYLRPATQGQLSITAEVKKRGEHLTICEADIEQEGRSVAHALATFALKHT